MADARFDIHFRGQLVAGASPALVKANLMKLFKIDESRADAMLSGRPVVLKRDADQATAMKFRAALKQAGALCELVALNQSESEEINLTVAAPIPATPVNTTSSAVASPSAASASPAVARAVSGAAGGLETVGTIRTGGQGFVGAFEVAPVGADMEQAPDTREPVVPDISGLSMAAVGSDLGQKRTPPPPLAPDTSGISLAPLKP